MWAGAVAAAFLPCAPPQAHARLTEFDAWDIVQINGQRVGHAHTIVRLVDESGRRVARVQQVTQLSLERFGQETRMEVDYSDRETVDVRYWTSNW